jgi:hypothetical protein
MEIKNVIYRKNLFTLAEEKFTIRYDTTKIFENNKIAYLLNIIEDSFDEAFTYFWSTLNSKIPKEDLKFLVVSHTLSGNGTENDREMF